MSHWLGMRADVTDETCQQIDELIEGFALGSLETDERLLVSDTIGYCPDAAERLRHYEETVGLLGLAVPSIMPAEGLWTRLERSAREREPSQNVFAFPGKPARGLTVPRWAAALASVAAVLLLATSISLGVAMQRSDDDEANSSDETVAEYLMSGGEMVQLTSWAAPEWMTWPGRGTLITAPDMPPVVMVDKCAPTGDTDWDYVVWLISGDERTAMGQMEINEDGKGILQLKGVESLENYDAIVVSIRKNDSTVYDVMEGSPKQEG